MALTASGKPVPWEEGRSVTPAANNYTGRYASAPRMGGAAGDALSPDAYHSMAGGRSMTPSGRGTAAEPRTPSSTGLIRLSLKKPMGIVFEPMYDANNATVQRGVRICDLPRTGAAALSRKLQVGDELLQINDTTVSRLTFDEIMDFIIEADPDSVNLLFRRPRKDMLQARQGVQQKLNAAANKDAIATVKWVDEEAEEKKSKKKKKKSKRTKKNSVSDEDETLQSKSTGGEDSYVKSTSAKKGKGLKSKSGKRGNPYETESFLDMLIDTICSDSGNVCRDTFRRNDDEYISEDESFATEEDTYATYEEEEPRSSKGKEEKIVSKKKYEDDGTLETVETTERPIVNPVNPVVPPLGLAPNPPPVNPMVRTDDVDDIGGVPAPIKELEYDDRIEADVSVMESLGGPSLLIEKQRAAQQAAHQQIIPADILEKYGLDYPVVTGMTREQTILADPVRFYSYVVKQLLQDNEPEKVRLLDKLLAKYRGREDHLVQKLSVRYAREDPQPHDTEAFTDAVKKNKHSSVAAATVNTAKERLQKNHTVVEDAEEDDEPHQYEQWHGKETKEQDDGDDASESGSEYSRDSVDGTSPAVIAQVSELLNYVYGKTSVPGQIDRVSTIMRAYEGREAVLLELLETKALIKANKEKENAEALPSFLRNTPVGSQAMPPPTDNDNSHLPPVTPMATNPQQGGTVINDDISSMSGVSSPAAAELSEQHEVEAPSHMAQLKGKESSESPMKEVPKMNSSTTGSVVSRGSGAKPPPTTPDKRVRKKGLFGGLFGGGKKKTKASVVSADRPASRLRKLKGVKSVEGSI
jgi:PDZ domain